MRGKALGLDLVKLLERRASDQGRNREPPLKCPLPHPFPLLVSQPNVHLSRSHVYTLYVDAGAVNIER